MNKKIIWAIVIALFAYVFVMCWLYNNANVNTIQLTQIQPKVCTITIDAYKTKAIAEGFTVTEVTKIRELTDFLTKNNPNISLNPGVTSVVFFTFPDGTMIALEVVGKCPVAGVKVDPPFFQKLMEYLKGIEL